MKDFPAELNVSKFNPTEEGAEEAKSTEEAKAEEEEPNKDQKQK